MTDKAQTKESVAFELMRLIKAHEKNAYQDKDSILSLYRECLGAMEGQKTHEEVLKEL